MSFRIDIPKRRRTYVRLIGQVQHALNQALSEEHERRGLTRAGMAAILGTDKSFITRKLTGESNMTLETLADLAYALDRPVKVTLPSRHERRGMNSIDKIEPSSSAKSFHGDGNIVFDDAI